MRLEGKVSLITGGGSGIGRAICELFAREGSKVVVSDIVSKAGQEVAERIKANGGDAAFIAADVTNAEQVKKMVKFTVDTYGKLNVLGNIAGGWVGELFLNVAELPEEVWDKVIDLNLKGTFLPCKYAMPELERAGDGSIINISSIAGQTGNEQIAYGSAKHGVIGFTRCLAVQSPRSGGRRVRANVIAPGQHMTPQFKSWMKGSTMAEVRYQQAQPVLEGAGEGGKGTADDVAYCALYLASDESSYVTGGCFSVDGGMALR